MEVIEVAFQAFPIHRSKRVTTLLLFPDSKGLFITSIVMAIDALITG